MLSLIIPTYNESENIPPLLSQLDRIFYQEDVTDYEVLVMDDDSPDGTSDIVNDLGLKGMRAVNRKGKTRGLSYAVLDGFNVAKGDVLAVMDADLSHNPKILPEMYRAVKDEGFNVALGSRYVRGGGIKNWPFKRRLVSRVACWMALPVTRVKDATSGYFAVKRNVIEGVDLSPLGFKIGLEVFVKAKHEGRIKEVPYVFTDRTRGESKLSGKVINEYLRQLGNLMKGK